MESLSVTPQSYRNAIFAGGGSRCIWQLGFWRGANEHSTEVLGDIDYAACTSAGSAMAVAALMGETHRAFEIFYRITQTNPANINWSWLKPGNSGPLLPHSGLLRTALSQFFSTKDLGDLGGRQVDFLMSRPPAWLPGWTAPLAAFSTYALEKRVKRSLHPTWPSKLGFQPRVWSSAAARDTDDLANMILASSSVPPVLPNPSYRGERVLDGGLIDNVPAFLTDTRAGRTLVLLSRQYRALPDETTDRVYAQPSEPIRLSKFDYSDPDGLAEAYELGARDGLAFAQLSEGAC